MRNARSKVQTFRFFVNMNYAECEALYRHKIKFLIVTDIAGKRIQLPKQNMQKFITPAGLQGSFELSIDQNQKIASIHKV